MLNIKVQLIAIIIITASVALSMASVWNDSVIVDEVPHIGAGYSYLKKQDMRINPEHPPLVKDLAAIPLLFQDINQDAFKDPSWAEALNGQWVFGRNVIFGQGNDSQKITRSAKMPMLVFFVLSAILVFQWSRKLYGDKAGLMALFLFSFSTTIMAHSRFVTTDVAAMFGIVSATYFYVKWLEEHSNKNLWIAGLVLGVALITKFSTFLLLPFFFILAFIYGILSTNRFHTTCYLLLVTMVIIIIAFVFIVWPVYYFHTIGYPTERQLSDTVENLSTYGNRNFADIVIWMADKPVLRALGQYGLGLLMVVQRSVGGNTTFFLGETSKYGWWYYFPVVYFIKETLAWWGLVIMAVITFVITKTLRPRIGLKDFLKSNFTQFAMFLWLVVYWYTSMDSTLNIGVRHLLPVYPFTIILVSGQISQIAGIIKRETQTLIFTSNLLIMILFTWYFVENIRVYPYYLTYFNQAVGGPLNGYKYVVDSNLDWGQDLKRLSDWIEKNNIKKIEVDYFGWADQSYYLGDKVVWLSSEKYGGYDDFIARNKTDGWIAVSASFLQGSEGPKEEGFKQPNYLWLHELKPVTVIGNSILIYNIK